MEDGNHNLDCHCSFNFYYYAIFQTKISSIRVKFYFDRTTFDNRFSNSNGVCGATYFDETIQKLAK